MESILIFLLCNVCTCYHGGSCERKTKYLFSRNDFRQLFLNSP
uniref:Uncharacterized protein n=1 Tax=Arundo donax TaxID=35708 RepID=A0A0A9EVR9_ARUDO